MDQSMVEGGKRDVERDVVVAGGEGLEVGADFIADVAVGGGAVGADDADVDEAVLHEMAAGVVDDDGVGDALLVEFPGGERCALIAGASFVDPDVEGGGRLPGP